MQLIDDGFEDRLIARIAVREATAGLEPRRKRILRRLMHGDLLDEIGADEGVSKSRIAQIRDKTLRNLRAQLRTALPLAPTAEIGPPPGFDHAAFWRHMAWLQKTRREEQERERGYLLEREAHALQNLIDRETPPVWIPTPKPPPAPPAPSQWWLILLRIPIHRRTEHQKISLACFLEEELILRGAHPMKPLDQETADRYNALTSNAQALVKHDWLMANLPTLWQRFPPAPIL